MWIIVRMNHKMNLLMSKNKISEFAGTSFLQNKNQITLFSLIVKYAVNIVFEQMIDNI